MFCPECGCDLILSCDAITEEYRGYIFEVEGIEHHVCPLCGEYIIDAAAAKALSRSLRNQYAHLQGLLSPDEIVSIRRSLGLTQEEFQNMLGVTGITASRWETGRAQQSKTMDNLLRGVRDYPAFAADLIKRANDTNTTSRMAAHS